MFCSAEHAADIVSNIDKATCVVRNAHGSDPALCGCIPSSVCVATQVDGLSHVVHSEEEALGTRITIDSLTCLLANESDPSRLIASSPGKLIRYLLPDGSHVKTDQPYAEVEVSRWQTHAVHAETIS